MKRGYRKLHEFVEDDRVEIAHANAPRLNGMQGTVTKVDRAVINVKLDIGPPIQLHYTKLKHIDPLDKMADLS